MKKHWMRLAFLALGGVALAQGHRAEAQAPAPDAAIAARQVGMDLAAGNLDAMKQGVATKADVKAFAEGAAAVARWGKVIPSLFPQGTDKGGDTKALPAIWSDRAGFGKAAAKLTTEADALAKAAKADDKDAFVTAFKATAAACGACHRAYKAK